MWDRITERPRRSVPGFISDSPLAQDLIRIGDEAIAHEDEPTLREYFAEDYVFHGPGGDLAFEELRAYFASLRSAFSGLRIVREQVIADGNFLAGADPVLGRFHGRVHVFAHRPGRTHRHAHRMGSDRHLQVRR